MRARRVERTNERYNLYVLGSLSRTRHCPRSFPGAMDSPGGVRVADDVEEPPAEEMPLEARSPRPLGRVPSASFLERRKHQEEKEREVSPSAAAASWLVSAASADAESGSATDRYSSELARERSLARARSASALGTAMAAPPPPASPPPPADGPPSGAPPSPPPPARSRSSGGFDDVVEPPPTLPPPSESAPTLDSIGSVSSILTPAPAKAVTFGGGAVAEDSGAGPGELSGPGPEEVSEEVTGSEPLPLMPQGSEYTTTYLSSGLAEKVARRAGREEVAAFDVVLTSIFTPDERAIALEVGEHGVSLRDPQGALIKVLPIEHLTGWGHKEDVTPCVFTLVVSEDLTTFDKMHFQVSRRTAPGCIRRRVTQRRLKPVGSARLASVLCLARRRGWPSPAARPSLDCARCLWLGPRPQRLPPALAQIDTGKGAELEAALQEAAERRAEAVEKEQLAELEREEQRPSILRALSRAPSAIRKSLRDPSVSRRESENQFPGVRRSRSSKPPRARPALAPRSPCARPALALRTSRPALALHARLVCRLLTLVTGPATAVPGA